MGAQICKCQRCAADATMAWEDGTEHLGSIVPVEAVALMGSQDKGVASFFSQVKLFSGLPEEDLPVLASCAQTVSFQKGEVMIRQGDEGNEFFVIQSGDADVHADDTKVGQLSAGDYFGEYALLRDEPRTATITASSQVTAVKVTRQKFHALGLHAKLDFPQRKAVGGGVGDQNQVKPPSPKTEEERRYMREALMKNANLNTMAKLDEHRVATMVDLAWRQDVPKGTALIEEGDLHADRFFVVQSGRFAVSKATQVRSISERLDGASCDVDVGEMGPGSSFGELALLHFAPRAASVHAKEDSVVWVVHRAHFKAALAQSSQETEKEYVNILGRVEVLKPLLPEEKQLVAKSLMEVHFVADEEIFHQGEEGLDFYILVEGEVAVIKNGKQSAKLKATATQSHSFGEQALQKNEPRTATVKVVSKTAKALSLDKQSFELLLGPLEDLKAGMRREASAPSKMKVAPTPSEKESGRIRKKNLVSVGLLGCGGFGAVELVEHTTTNVTYALKAISKGFIVKSDMQKNVISEKEVQMMCDSPFIVRLYETYSGPETLYLLLELALGGELFTVYNRKNFWGLHSHARYYAGGTVLAFEHLHSKKIIFRDLKPENLLLNEQGHVKLTDMGLAKVVIGKTYTTVGTPDYFAPELISSSGTTSAYDWWTLGILIYELLVGRTPFESATPMQIYNKVVKGIAKVPFPPKVRGDPEALIKALCELEPTQRLPMKKGGSKNIKKHRWYGGFKWEALQDLSMEPPHKPVVNSPKDIANFGARAAARPPQVAYKDDGSGWDQDFATST